MSFVEKYGKMTVEEALELAHQDYEKRRNEILSKIITIRSDVKTHKVYKEWLNQVYDFVKEREI